MAYTNIDNNIMNYNISDGAFKLYFLLQSMCYNDKTECFPSQRYLSEKLNKSVRTIQRYISELLNCGLLKKKRRGSISNLYTVMLKVTAQKTAAIVNKVREIKGKSQSYVKSNANTKHSVWNIGHRDYDFNKLENMLLGRENYDTERLYK